VALNVSNDLKQFITMGCSS